MIQSDNKYNITNDTHVIYNMYKWWQMIHNKWYKVRTNDTHVIYNMYKWYTLQDSTHDPHGVHMPYMIVQMIHITCDVSATHVAYIVY